MKKYMLLHYGFEMPTQEIMQAWGAWFESIKDISDDTGSHFMKGLEISKQGTKELPLAADSITGYTFINAENMEEASKVAQRCPSISSIRVYEMKTQ